jgi:hypothetical protein
VSNGVCSTCISATGTPSERCIKLWPAKVLILQQDGKNTLGCRSSHGIHHSAGLDRLICWWRRRSFHRHGCWSGRCHTRRCGAPKHKGSSPCASWSLCLMELPRSLCYLIQQPAQVQLNSAAMRHAVINKIHYRKRLQIHEPRVPLDHK